MPYVKDWPPKRLMAVVAAGFALLIVPPAAHADAPTKGCPLPSTSQVFSQFGDSAQYALVPGADFEDDMSGWSLDNASVASGNEPSDVGSSSDSQSLSIAPGGEAVSPPFCVSNLFPTLRFFAQASSERSSWWGTGLRVSLQFTDNVNGFHSRIPLAWLFSRTFSSWQPTSQLLLGAMLPNGRSLTARLVFDAGSNSTWNIDDVYVDPYAK